MMDTKDALAARWLEVGRRSRVWAKYLVLKRRGLALLAFGGFAAMLGIAAVLTLARNTDSAGTTLVGFGHVYRIALPKGVARLEDIRTFEIYSDGADDLMRAVLNGHLVAHTETPWKAVVPDSLHTKTEDDPTARKLSSDNVVDRQTYLTGRKAVQWTLVRGWNLLVVEVVNYGGPCGGGVQLFVNDQPIAGAPSALPIRSGPDDAMRLIPTAHKEHALCARVAYQFHID